MSGWYGCKECDLEFVSKKSYNGHMIFAHKTTSPSVKKILILGGGFGGINVLRKVQKMFTKDKVSITIVNEENYFLFTPMLPQVAAGMLHPSNISIPIRIFCKNSKFYQATVSDIDLSQKLVTITRTFDGKVHALEYDFLVLALGSQNNFFGNKNIEENSFTIKTIEDAISLRNHIINMLENAAQTGDSDLQKKFLTFTVVGGGFAGVETVGELNHFVRQASENAYPSIDTDNISINLISSGNRILPEVGSKLGKKAMKHLKNVGVKVLINTKAQDASEDSVTLNDGKEIPCTTIIWAGGVVIDSVIQTLDCEHGDRGKILVDEFLRLKSNPEVFALGDCAEIINSSGKSYPPTAQHALRESKTVSQNILASINGKSSLRKFSYNSKGMMATLGNHSGVASIFGHSFAGISAWLIWRSYYLMNIPTFEKKLKVAIDWTLDLFYKRDLTLVGKIKKKELRQVHIGQEMPSLKDQLFVDL